MFALNFSKKRITNVIQTTALMLTDVALKRVTNGAWKRIKLKLGISFSVGGLFPLFSPSSFIPESFARKCDSREKKKERKNH
jgi:hypothetical protein